MSQSRLYEVTSARDDAALEPQVGDAALTRLAAAGDRQAMTVIWRRYRVMVRSVVVATLGPDPEVDDLVQEVFLELLRGVNQMRDGTALRAMLTRIAIRRVGMVLRKRRIRSLMLFLPWTEVPEVPVLGPDVDDRLAVVALYRLLRRVRRKPRFAFLLHYVHGMTRDEVAETLGVSFATVKRLITEGRGALVRLARAEARLRRFLPPEDGATR